MVHMKNKWVFLLINIFTSTIIFLVSASTYNFKHFINSIFYLTMVYVILMLFLFIIKGRFFDGISWSFRRFRSIMFKEGDYLLELGDSPKPSDRISISFYRFILFQTSALVGIIILILGIYYYI
ncbi:DUF3899 domain-containing protein [Virgibacillus flavescens]|uniref:DUF3899 domain-containing protein n=1 Tax=Virgibacillus flavescens TaxID=1611422 RepID=UPI003D34F708